MLRFAAMLIGAHIQTAWGYPRTVAYAEEVGCEAIQIFAKSPQQWQGRPIDPAAAEAFRIAREAAGLFRLYTHTAYLINLGSRDSDLWRKSIMALADEISRAALLGATATVTHIGTRFDPDNMERSADRVVEGVWHAVERSGVEPGTVRVLLENTAGAGTTFGGSFEELGAIVAALEARGLSDVGLCVDTCHAWAYGIDLSSAEGWDHLLTQIEAACGPAKIGAIHANDCKFGLGSRKDRHEWIGDGEIGADGFRAMVCEPRLRNVTALIEMPGEMPAKDAENLARLRAFRAGCWEG